MGFGRFGSLYYFADRVSATIRGALRDRLGYAVPVVGIGTDPIGCLISRQTYLLRELHRLDEELGGVERFHLVGHSTGGVDAELLTCRDPLKGKYWNIASEQRRRIASVTTLSAPHYGTCLVESPAAGWFLSPFDPRGLREATQMIGSLLFLFASRSLSSDALIALLYAAPESALFVSRFLTHRKLIEDLRPDNLARLRAENPPDSEIPASVRCFVSVTPPEPAQISGVPRACDKFFQHMHMLTATYAQNHAAVETDRFLEILERHREAEHIISNPAAMLKPLDVEANDGVVNAARQLLTTHAPAERPDQAFGAIVVGDHGDVIGHYDRQDRLMAGRIMNHGFFRSGSGFGDTEFFELWGRIATHVAEAAAV